MWTCLFLTIAVTFSLNSVHGSSRNREDTLGGGQPGRDFPILTSVPKQTNFNCRDKIPGYYADEEYGCQVFHICHTATRKDSFLCPNGTIFHQSRLICDWWYNVDCASTPLHHDANIEYGKAAPKQGRTENQPSRAQISQQRPRVSQKTHAESDHVASQRKVPVLRDQSSVTKPNLQHHRKEVSQQGVQGKPLPILNTPTRQSVESPKVPQISQKNIQQHQLSPKQEPQLQIPSSRGISISSSQFGSNLDRITPPKATQTSSIQPSREHVVSPIEKNIHASLDLHQVSQGRPLPSPQTPFTPVSHQKPQQIEPQAPLNRVSFQGRTSSIPDRNTSPQIFSGRPLPSIPIGSSAVDVSSSRTKTPSQSQIGRPLPSSPESNKHRFVSPASLAQTNNKERGRPIPQPNPEIEKPQTLVASDNKKPLLNAHNPLTRFKNGRPLPSSPKQTSFHQKQQFGKAHPVDTAKPINSQRTSIPVVSKPPSTPVSTLATSQHLPTPPFFSLPSKFGTQFPQSVPFPHNFLHNRKSTSIHGRPLPPPPQLIGFRSTARPHTNISIPTQSPKRPGKPLPSIQSIAPPTTTPASIGRPLQAPRQRQPANKSRVKVNVRPVSQVGRPLSVLQQTPRRPISSANQFKTKQQTFESNQNFPGKPRVKVKVRPLNQSGRPLQSTGANLRGQSPPGTVRNPNTNVVSKEPSPHFSNAGRPLPAPAKTGRAESPKQQTTKVSTSRNRNRGSTTFLTSSRASSFFKNRLQNNNGIPRRNQVVIQKVQRTQEDNTNVDISSQKTGRGHFEGRKFDDNHFTQGRPLNGKFDHTDEVHFNQRRFHATNKVSLNRFGNRRLNVDLTDEVFDDDDFDNRKFGRDRTDEIFDDIDITSNENLGVDITDEVFDDDRFNRRKLIRDRTDEIFDTRVPVVRRVISRDRTDEIFDDDQFINSRLGRDRTDEIFDDDHFVGTRLGRDRTDEVFDNTRFANTRLGRDRTDEVFDNNRFANTRLGRDRTDEVFDDHRITRTRLSRDRTDEVFDDHHFVNTRLGRGRTDALSRTRLGRDRTDEVFDDDHFNRGRLGIDRTDEAFDDDAFVNQRLGRDRTDERFDRTRLSSRRLDRDRTDEIFDYDNFGNDRTDEQFDDGFDRFDVDDLFDDDRIDRFGNAAGFSFGRTARGSNPIHVVKKVKRIEAPPEIQLPPPPPER